MGEWAQQMIAMVRDRIENEADSIGVEMVADIRDKISIPVEYSEGPSGTIVIRSDPFTYPRREFGRLWEGERHEVLSGPIIELNIINDCEYARRLHDGHDNVDPRPFHDLAMVEWTPQIGPRIQDAIVGIR